MNGISNDWQNPYWAVNLNTNNDRRDRVIGFVSLKYQFADWASLSIRSGTDFYYDKRENRNASGTIYRNTPGKSLYAVTDLRVEEQNSDFLWMLTPQINDDLGFDINLGGNIRKLSSESLTSTALGLNITDQFIIQNGVSTQTIQGISNKKVQSLYGTVSMDYRRIFFVDFSARNDWSSTLASGNRSYFYPAVSSSFVFSDALGIESDILSYGKIRASVATVGNDTDPYRLQTLYAINTLSHGGQTFGQILSTQAPENLKPERTTSYELGFTLDFFHTRINLDATYYTAGTRNQIYAVPTSKASGFQRKTINGGLVQNQGLELLLKTKIIDEGNFKWSTNINFTKNRSTVKELSEGVTSIKLGEFDQFGITVQSDVGQPFGNIYANKSFLRDPDTGERIIKDKGLPTSDPGVGLKKIGNFQPDWLAGIKNNFSYKNFTLGVLIDIKKGGDIFSYSNAVAAWNGNAAFTEDQRREWYAGAGGYVAKGVTADGSVNTKEVDPQAYWQTVGGATSNFAEEFIYDGTFVKLRELTLAYTMSRQMLEKLPLKNVTFSLVGRNLFFIHKNTPGFDPEATFNSGNNQGIEAFAFPSTRSYGFNLSFSL